jgi:hypothetical protein
VRRLGRLRFQQWCLLAETCVTLVFASIAVRILSFRKIGKLAGWPLSTPASDSERWIEPIREIRWAVLACAARAPWRAKCFEEGLAAHLILRRRGIPSTLFFGAASVADKGFIAHVWVRAENMDVIGTESAQQFAVLARFPAAP